MKSGIEECQLATLLPNRDINLEDPCSGATAGPQHVCGCVGVCVEVSRRKSLGQEMGP